MMTTATFCNHYATVRFGRPFRCGACALAGKKQMAHDATGSARNYIRGQRRNFAWLLMDLVNGGEMFGAGFALGFNSSTLF